jgi:hypothetical protein
VAPGEVTDEVRVGFGVLSAEPMVVVGNGEAETGLGSHLEEEIEEADGIGAARHGHKDLAAAPEKGRPGEGAAKGLQDHLL